MIRNTDSQYRSRNTTSPPTHPTPRSAPPNPAYANPKNATIAAPTMVETSIARSFLDILLVTFASNSSCHHRHIDKTLRIQYNIFIRTNK